MKLTIFTPTYNRSELLTRLYKSLLNQSCHDFEWIIVDDGSSDNTENNINNIIKNNSLFPIYYYKKENGGKCSAINIGVKKSRCDWFFIVDSDDILMQKAVETIYRYIKIYDSNQDVCALGFLRAKPNGECIGGEVDYDTLVSDFFSYRNRLHYKGDRAEVIRLNVMKEYPFPEYTGEKFISEALVWNRMAKKYKCVYINEKIYITEYIEDGLSNTSSNLFSNSPKGSMLFYKENFLDAIRIKDKAISALLYWRFYFSTRIKNNPELKPCISMYPYLIGYPLYLIIRFIYHKTNKNLIAKLNK